MNNIRKFVFTGPESSGKTTLSEWIANHFDFLLVKEYAREYLKDLDRAYTLEDVLTIAEIQSSNEEASYMIGRFPIICDTDLTVIDVWLEHKFKYKVGWIFNKIKNNLPETFYFLCYPDIDWEKDPLRENPHDRLELFDLYENLLIKIGANYLVLKGSFTEKLEICQKIIQA